MTFLPGLLFQLDLIFEPCAPHKAKQEVLPVSTALLEQYKQLFLSIKDKAPEEMDLIALKDLHLDRDMGGISIAALHTALPTLPRVSARLGADMEAALLGGLDPVTPVRAPPVKCSRSVEMRERQYFGAKWDLSEYYEENPEGENFKIYSKHLSVLYRSYDVAGDFDYRHFGFTLQESYQLDQRCRMLCEGHAEVLHKTNEWRRRCEASRDYGLFTGLSGTRESWSLSSFVESNPARIICKVSEALNFTGPVRALDTDDSSGLVACAMAVEELRKPQACPVAFASSASWISSPLELALHCSTGMASRSGRTRCFDQSADGFTQGEGTVVLMLRPASAKAEWTVVGSAMNSRGQDASLRAPSAPAMEDVLMKATRDAQLSFLVVDAVETSANGSPMDVGELELLGKMLRHKDEAQVPVMTSSSKASWGHLGPVSGLVGVARSLSLMGRCLYGPQLHLRQLLPLEQSRLHFCAEATQGLSHTQLLSVASFGLGCNCQHLISVKQHRKAPKKAKLSWCPTPTQQKDVLMVISGYYLIGSVTAWKDGILMEAHKEDPTLFFCLLTIPQSGWHKFQLWIDQDPERVLHPPLGCETSESAVLGPEACDRQMSWKVIGTPGDRVEIRLQVNGRYKRVSWQKVSLTPLPEAPQNLSILGDHNFWSFEAMMATETDGIFEAQIKLLKEKSNFQIFCDEDFEQGFYPASDAAEIGIPGDGEWWMLDTNAIVGPDDRGDGQHFHLLGEVGDVYRVVFDTIRRSLSWQRSHSSPVDFEEVWRSQKYFVVGSWNNFQNCQEMISNNEGSSASWSVEVQMVNDVETFQILVSGNWLCAFHPCQQMAKMDAELEGPDDGGHDRFWCIGGSDDVMLGDLVEIHLELVEGRPSKVWWKKSESERQHHLRYSQGLKRTLQRHLRLHGLVPFDSQTHTAAQRFNDDVPDFWHGDRLKEETDTLMVFYNQLQEVLAKHKVAVEDPVVVASA